MRPLPVLVPSLLALSLPVVSLNAAESPIVVTGTKTERTITDVPIRTEIIDRESMINKGAINVYEALDGTPGIRVEQQCSACNFSQVRMQGLDASHVQVLVDGQPTYSGLAAVYGLQQIAAEQLERIEVVKGAGSAMCSSSAIAGSINLISREPSDEPELRVSMVGGSHNTNSFSMSASLKDNKDDRWDAVIDATKNTGDLIDENGDGISDRVWSDDMSVGARVHVHDALGGDLALTFRHTQEARKGGELATYENPFAAGAEHIDTLRSEYGIGYRTEMETGGSLAVKLNYADHERIATNDTFLGDYETEFGALPTADLMAPYVAAEETVVLNIDYVHPLNDAHTLLIGASLSYDELDETGRYVDAAGTDGGSDGKAYTSLADKEAQDYGLYVQDEWVVSEELEAVLGLRFDSHRSEETFGEQGGTDEISTDFSESKVNPRVALKWNVSDELVVRSAVGTGFRAPYGFSEDLHLCSGSPRVFKGGDLQAESSVGFNVGADYRAETFVVSANVFYTEVSDKIDFADASAAAAARGYDYEWVNAGDAITQGIEVSADVEVHDDLELVWDATWTKAEYDGGEDIRRVPTWTSGLDLTWTPSQATVALGIDVTGDMLIDNENTGETVETDAFAVVNLRVAWAFEDAQSSVFVGAKNLFDEVQEDRDTEDPAFIYGPLFGRIVYAGVSKTF